MMIVQWAIWILARVEIHDLVNGTVAGIDKLAISGLSRMQGFAINGQSRWMCFGHQRREVLSSSEFIECVMSDIRHSQFWRLLQGSGVSSFDKTTNIKLDY